MVFTKRLREGIQVKVGRDPLDDGSVVVDSITAMKLREITLPPGACDTAPSEVDAIERAWRRKRINHSTAIEWGRLGGVRT